MRAPWRRSSRLHQERLRDTAKRCSRSRGEAGAATCPVALPRRRADLAEVGNCEVLIRSPRRAVFAVAILLLCGAERMEAFEGEEHRRISQVAYELAIESLKVGLHSDSAEGCSPAPWTAMTSKYSTVDEAAREVLSFLQGQGESAFSFGSLVSSIDHIDDPNKLLRPDFKEGLGSARATKFGCPVLWGGEEVQGDDDRTNWVCDSPKSLRDINFENIRHATSNGSNRINALHSNSSHFQDQLAYSIWEWFRRAREEASAAGAEEYAKASGDRGGKPAELREAGTRSEQLDSAVAQLEKEIKTLRESLSLLEEKAKARKKADSSRDLKSDQRPGRPGRPAPGDRPVAQPQTRAETSEVATPRESLVEAEEGTLDTASAPVALPPNEPAVTPGKEAAALAVESADQLIQTIKEQLDVLVVQLEAAKAQAVSETRRRSLEARATRRQQQHALYTALIEAAIAAHYIEDSFAPGHIITMREARADYPANTLHDRYNFTGRCFAISKKERGRVAHFLGTLEGLLEQDEKLLKELELKKDDVKAYFAELSSLEDPIPVARAGDPAAAKPRCEESKGSFLFRGDGDLLTPASFGVKDSWCGTPACTQESERQRLLVTLVVARAVSELLEAYAHGVLGEESCPTPQLLAAYDWKRMKKSKERSLLGDLVEMPSLVTAIGRFEETDSESGSVKVEPVTYGFMGLVEIGATTFLEGGRESESGRGIVGFEWTPTWGPAGESSTGYYTPKYHSYGWGFGGAYRFDEELEGVDATVRLYYQLPKIDMFFAVGSRVSYLRWDDKESTRVVPEFRAGRTFGGFLNIYVGAAHDFRLTSTRELDRTLSLTTGAQVGLPWWRIAHWVAGWGDKRR